MVKRIGEEDLIRWHLKRTLLVITLIIVGVFCIVNFHVLKCKLCGEKGADLLRLLKSKLDYDNLYLYNNVPKGK